MWAALLLPALFGGPAWMALLLAPTAALAALQAGRSWRRADTRPPVEGLAGLGAAALVVGAIFGWVGLVGAAGLTVAAAVALDRLVARRHRAGRVRTARSLGRTLVLAGLPGAAGAGPVALRQMSSHGAVPALALCTYALVFDASSFLVGSGAGRVWEGPLAGMASIGAVTVAIAAILVPPFRGASPWLLGVAAAVLTPLGVVAASVTLGDRRAPAPALRRLDSLILLGPIGALLALIVVG